VTAQTLPIAVQELAIVGVLQIAAHPANVFPTGPELARVIVLPAPVVGTRSGIAVFPAVPEPAAVAGSEEVRAAIVAPARARAAVEALQASGLRVAAVEVLVVAVVPVAVVPVAVVAAVVAAVEGGNRL
jgi:hypothetical protein